MMSKLSTAERDILLNPVGYLNDSIIAAAQALLKNQSISQGGFQDTVLGLTCNFQIETEEFVQILFNGHNHWLVISTVGAVDDSEVFVYDRDQESGCCSSCHEKEGNQAQVYGRPNSIRWI